MQCALHLVRQPLRFLVDDGDEARPLRAVHVRKGLHGFHCGAQVGQRAARIAGQHQQQCIASAVGLDIAGDVFEHQHETIERAILAEHRRHARSHQLAATQRGDETRRRFDAAPLLFVLALQRPGTQAMLDQLQGMHHQPALDHAEQRTPQTDRRRRGIAALPQ